MTDNDRPLGPGGVWRFLAPAIDQSGAWFCRCPLGCGGNVMLLCVDPGAVLPRYVLGGRCTNGCAEEAMAFRLHVVTGGEPRGFTRRIGS